MNPRNNEMKEFVAYNEFHWKYDIWTHVAEPSFRFRYLLKLQVFPVSCDETSAFVVVTFQHFLERI
jgi:hypothetical protein